jgi:LmbE family N-acetylglucosaminyl deacetylase
LVALSRQAGRRVAIVYLTSGENSHVDCCGTKPAEVGLRREQLAIAAGGELGVAEQDLHFLRLPDGGIPAPLGLQQIQAHGRGCDGDSPSAQGFAQAVGRLAAIIMAFGAEHVYCPHAMDCRKDHQSAAMVTLAAIGQTGLDCAVHSYLVWGFFKLPLGAIRRLLRARPWSLDISGALAAKKAAMSRYFDSCAPCGLPYVGRLPAGFAEFFANRREYFFDGL